MARYFRPEERDQVLLFPPSLEDYLPEGHPARFYRDLVSDLDEQGKLAPLYTEYREDGRGGQPYNPATMLSIVLYGYSRGIQTSRQLEWACVENLGFRYLAANQRPNFRTIAAFRRRHAEFVTHLFKESLSLCDAAGLVDLCLVGVDGRRVQGNASKDKTLTREAIEQKYADLAKEIVEEAERADLAEDKQLGDGLGYELPPGFHSKQARLERLKRARQVLEERDQRLLEKHEAKLEARRRFEAETGEKKKGPPPRAPDLSKSKGGSAPKANTTDPDSRLMKTREGFKQGYNGQIAVDAKGGVIVAADVTQDTVDTRQLEPMLDEVEQNLGRLPNAAVADAGYWSPENADLQEERGVDLYIATQKDSRQRTAGKRALAPKGRIPQAASARERMERKLLTQRGRNVYRRRGPTAEGPFGLMVTKGFTRFLLRGLEAVRAEWRLWCLVHNLEKLRRSNRAQAAAA